MNARAEIGARKEDNHDEDFGCHKGAKHVDRGRKVESEDDNEENASGEETNNNCEGHEHHSSFYIPDGTPGSAGGARNAGSNSKRESEKQTDCKTQGDQDALISDGECANVGRFGRWRRSNTARAF